MKPEPNDRNIQQNITKVIFLLFKYDGLLLLKFSLTL